MREKTGVVDKPLEGCCYSCKLMALHTMNTNSSSKIWHGGRRLWIFIVYGLLLMALLIPGTIGKQKAHIRERTKRSNIPCGSAFTPCNRRPTGFSRPFDSREIESRPNQFVATPNIRHQMVLLATQEAKEDVDKIFNQTESFLVQNNFIDRSELGRLWSAYTRSYKYPKDLSYSAMVSIGSSQRLRSFGLRTEEIIYGLPRMTVEGTILQQICPPNLIDDCVPGKYRTYSGFCNNVNHPLWGATYEPLQRYLAPDYSDEVGAPRMSVDGSILPNARQVSVEVFRTISKPHKTCSMMMAQWGQFVYNDIVQIAAVKGKSLSALPCCDPNVQHPECFPIPISVDDPDYQGFITCLPYTRTNPAPREDCLMGPREQGNLVTSFLDASSVYGSTKGRANDLRTFSDGKLKSSRIPFLKDLLPPENYNPGTCSSSRSQPCFKAGSDMVNFLPTLTSLHTIWARQHNLLADQLKLYNPHWGDERLYQEGRRIVGAQIQHITYTEFLPTIVGIDNIQNYGLELESNGFYSNYNLDMDASVLNTFAGSAGLIFYSMFPDHLNQFSREGAQTSQTRMSESFYNPGNLYFQDRLDSYIRFMLKESIRELDVHMSTEFKTKFLKGRGDFGLDMAAFAVQMGRDHGIPSYTVWRTQCGLRRPQSFDDLQDLVRDKALLKILPRLYKTVDDVDLFVLGLAERPNKGALVGPTFACIFSKQFQKTRRGDRFWYENFFFPSSFTENQLNEVRKTTLARLICDNTDNIGKIQPNVMSLEDNFENCPIKCNTSVIPNMDLSHWVDSEPKLHLPITQATLDKAVRLGTRHARELREQEGLRLRDPVAINTDEASFAHSNLLSAKQESLDIARTANILMETTKIILRGTELTEEEKLPSDLDKRTLQRLLPQVDVSRIVGNLSSNNARCVPNPLPCDHTTPYRTYNAWCNNLRFPHYGNTFNAFRRLLDPAYNDGFDEPRIVGSQGRPLPSTRVVSNAVHRTQTLPHEKYTHILMQFGQILDHDMTLSPMTRDAKEEVLNCSRCDSHLRLSVNCMPIKVPRDDPFFPPVMRDGSPRCIPFTRSLLGQLTLGYRNQINQLTSFIDASNIYGSTECEANDLRLFSMGKLNYTEKSEGLEQGLPQGFKEKDCRSLPRHICFVAGDERSNEQPALAAIHTIFLREHNRIATRLHRINNFWPDEKIFQETRRIMGALMQHITYSEFLPKVLGCEFMSKYDLQVQKTGYYKGYDPRCDATISNEFATAAFRFGHTLIRSEFPRMDDFFKNFSKPIKLRDNFLNVSSIYDRENGGVATIMIGLLGAPAESFDRHIAEDVRDHLFARTGVPHSGMDLPAINMQRGRDHGIPPYNEYREFCGMRRARTFSDLRDTTDEDAINSLRTVYRSVEDIDLFPGMISERPLRGALVGPTVACIISEQFQRLKKCDRFWYENDLPETRFTPDQLAEIRKMTLGKIVCGNSQSFIRKIQPRVFDMPDDLLNAQVACQDLPEMDLYEWLDRQFCVVDHRVINLGKTKRITPCVACTCTAEGPECHSIRVQNCLQLLEEFLFTEVMDDTVCVIQCSGLIRRRAGRL